MGRYLDLIAASADCEKSEKILEPGINSHISQLRLAPDGHFRAALRALEARCPEHVEPNDWRRAVRDGERFLAQWAEQAVALGWTARDLFSLHSVPDNPSPSYRRLSRYDQTGLIWLLCERPVVALTETQALIKGSGSGITVYRRVPCPAVSDILVNTSEAYPSGSRPPATGERVPIPDLGEVRASCERHRVHP